MMISGPRPSEQDVLKEQPVLLEEHVLDNHLLTALKSDPVYRAMVMLALLTATAYGSLLGGLKLQPGSYYISVWIGVVAVVLAGAWPYGRARWGGSLLVSLLACLFALLAVLPALPELSKDVALQRPVIAGCLAAPVLVLFARYLQFFILVFLLGASVAMMYLEQSAMMAHPLMILLGVVIFFQVVLTPGTGFGPVISAVAILQLTGPALGTGIPDPTFLHWLNDLPWPAHLFPVLTALQIALLMIEACALLVAGVRATNSSLSAQPRITYRVAPLCIVPKLDRSVDFSVRIDVA